MGDREREELGPESPYGQDVFVLLMAVYLSMPEAGISSVVSKG